MLLAGLLDLTDLLARPSPLRRRARLMAAAHDEMTAATRHRDQTIAELRGELTDTRRALADVPVWLEGLAAAHQADARYPETPDHRREAHAWAAHDLLDAARDFAERLHQLCHRQEPPR